MARMLIRPSPRTSRKSLQQRRTAALQRGRRDARNFHHIVGHQALAAADQFERELAFADAGLPRDEHPDPEHVHQHAVALDAVREPLGEVTGKLLDDAGRRQRRCKQRRARALRLCQQRRRRLDAVGKDQRRGRRSEQPIGECGDRSGLVDADDLDAVRMREVEVADQCRCRGRLAAHHGPAFAPGGPGERKRLAVVLMQLRDVDLEHPAAMR